MINVRILSMAIRTFFMANLDYAAAAGASCGGKGLLCRALCVVGPLTNGDGGVLRHCWRTPGRFLASRKAKMFWTLERVNWREEATGVGARKRSTTAIHAAEEALAPARGQVLSTARRRHSCARAPAQARTSVYAQAHALAGARARESRRGPRGTPWHQARRQCAAHSPTMPRGWALAQTGRRELERERGQARRLPARPVQARPKAPYVLETLAGCLPQETGTLRADHRDAAWHTFRSG